MIRALLALFGFDAAPIQQIESLRFDLAWGWAGLVLALLVVTPITILLYRMEDKPRSFALKVGLLTLRLFFFAGLLSLLAGPRLAVSGTVPQKNKLAVLVDSSRSMSISEEGRTRLDRVREVFSRDRLLDKLETKTGLSPAVFSFAGQVSPLAREDLASFAVAADGPQTNLTRAVTEIGNNLGEGNLLGIILLTDGGHNTGDNPLDALTRQRIPLYFLGAGKAGVARDLAVSIDRPPAVGFLNAAMKIRGEVRAWRTATGSIDVEVRRDGKTIERIAVTIPPGDHRAPFTFNIPCDAEGAFTWSVAVPRLPDELTYDNNETGFLLRVIKDRLQVLMLADGPTWDQGFLKAALRSDPNAHFTGFTKLKDDRWLVSEDFQLKGGAPQAAIGPELDKADVLIIAGVPEETLRPHAKLVLERLTTGKLGVLLLPGRRSYTELGYLGSPLAELFPVDLRGGTWKGVPSNVLLPSKEVPYSFLRLLDDPIENQDFFRTLPKWDGLYVWNSLNKGAEVLLSSTLQQPGFAAPGMVHQRVGQGHSVMLMGGPLWPMGFRLVAGGKGIRPYTAFSLNLLKWLANRREDAQVSLELPSTRLFVGQPATIRTWVFDAGRKPLDNAQVSGEITGQGMEPTRLTFLAAAEKGLYETTFVPYRKGQAEVRVEARHQAQPLGEAKSKVLIEMPTVEFDNPEVQVELMTRLASASGGLYRSTAEAADLVDRIIPTPGKKRETKVLELRDSPLLLVLLLLLPLAEWWIRRRRGYS